MIHAHSHIPSGIWVLGFVSMLMDISSEMIHSVLPLFMVTTLGASTIAVGLVEGLAESLALVVKIFSGTLSDYLGLHMGMTQGLLTAMIAGASPADLLGTAYGFFNLACGLALLVASVLAGIVWEQFGAQFTFYVGATCAACAIALIVYKESQPPGV